jgi:hypothetical protein
VLAAVTLLFREVFVPVTTSRTKGPHPPCGFTCWRHERCPNYPLPEKCEYPANKHNFICFTCHIPASPSSCACHDLCGATCARRKDGDVTSLIVTRIFVKDAGHILLQARSIIMQRIHRDIVPVVTSVVSGASTV